MIKIAERRMFAKTIIMSDSFLDMPTSARCLYFTLGMLADDDGFLNSPKSIMRQCGASIDDMKLLVSKDFIIPFESGVVVIKDWRIHNYIQKDRYHETKHIDEKNELYIAENGEYKRINSQCIQDVYKMDTEVRLGKDRLGKDNNTLDGCQMVANRLPNGIPRIDKDRIDKDRLENTQECERVFEEYNRICKSLPKANKLTDQRKKHISARLKTYSIDEIIKCFEMAEASDFLTGKTKGQFKASLDWLINENNLNKVLDGNYANSKKSNANFKEREDDFDAIAREIMANQSSL